MLSEDSFMSVAKVTGTNRILFPLCKRLKTYDVSINTRQSVLAMSVFPNEFIKEVTLLQ